jgi:hypothetical protein
MNEMNVTLKMNQTNLGTYRWRISLWKKRQVSLKLGNKPAADCLTSDSPQTPHCSLLCARS